VNNWNNCDCFQKSKENTTNRCTVIQPCFCCDIHNGRDALNYFGSRQVNEFSQQLAISNPTRSDFKYPSDFGLLKKCRIRMRNPSHPSLIMPLTGVVYTVRLDTTAQEQTVTKITCSGGQNVAAIQR